jgi:hypothetical protein
VRQRREEAAKKRAAEGRAPGYSATGIESSRCVCDLVTVCLCSAAAYLLSSEGRVSMVVCGSSVVSSTAVLLQYLKHI